MFHLTAVFVTLLLAPQDGMTTYQLKSNPKGLSEVRAKVLAVEDARAELVGIVNGEKRQGWVDLKWFTNVSRMRILKTGAEDGNVASQLRLARYAVSIGDTEEATRAWSEAVKLNGGTSPDPKLEQVINSQKANALQSQFHEEVYAGRTEVAEKTLAKIMKDHPDSKAAKDAPALRQQIQAKEQAMATANANAAAEKAEEKVSRMVEPAKKYIARANEEEKKALSGDGSTTQSKNHFLTSVRAAEAALKSVEHAAKQVKGESSATEETATLRAEALAVRKRSLLALGSYSLTRGQYNNATGYVNGILKYTPNDADALGMRARIETAANEDADWWGGIPRVVGGRGGRVAPQPRR